MKTKQTMHDDFRAYWDNRARNPKAPQPRSELAPTPVTKRSGPLQGQALWDSMIAAARKVGVTLQVFKVWFNCGRNDYHKQKAGGGYFTPARFNWEKMISWGVILLLELRLLGAYLHDL